MNAWRLMALAPQVKLNGRVFTDPLATSTVTLTHALYRVDNLLHGAETVKRF